MMAFGIAAFARKNRDVFEARESSEGHLAEDADAEKRQWRQHQRERMISRQSPVPDVEKWQRMSTAI